jgi:hypothetical protein
MECHHANGNTYYTREMSIQNVHAGQIENRLENDCGFKNKIRVRKTTNNNRLGVGFELFFEKVGQDLGQFRMISSFEDPIVGKDV